MSRFPHFLSNQQTNGGEFVRLMHWPPFTTRKISGTHFSHRLWLDGLGQLKNPMTSARMKPMTFWLAA
jgi:hypothetical protein